MATILRHVVTPKRPLMIPNKVNAVRYQEIIIIEIEQINNFLFVRYFFPSLTFLSL